MDAYICANYSAENIQKLWELTNCKTCEKFVPNLGSVLHAHSNVALVTERLARTTV